MDDAGPEVVIRLADAGDAPDIARIHMESWRRHYRGMYSDAYLDGDLYADRLKAWTEKLAKDRRTHFTLLAQTVGMTVGFAHVALDADATWGALVDNLHVSHSVQRGGIGTLLLDRVARMVAEQRRGSGIYLWVLEQNIQAIAFYEARKGVLRDSEPSAPPGGDPRHLHGTPQRIRVTWGDPATLLLRD
jgi:ribosomal protein S18 acetylase RimI-like enzyme